jgi:D-serine deaminase-like pyridoxal phosphate-dependent protein
VTQNWFYIENEAEIPSPSLLLYRARAEENIRRMLAIAGGPERLRPHVKTHKLAPLIRAQLAPGITKFKCATIAEAEMTGEAGAPDVLFAFPPLGPNVSRLLELQRQFPATSFSTIADSEESICALGEAARAARVTLPVLLDLDCGMGRTGVAPGPEAERLYRLIAETPGLTAGGLHAYDGHIHESNLVARKAHCDAEFSGVLALRAQLLRLGLPVPRLVAGGTPTFAIHAQHTDRELSPGTCVLWDFGYADKFPDLPFEVAALLLTRVVSKPGANRLCLDLGHKAVAAENPPPRVRLLELPDATSIVHSEEHLVIETPRANEFRIGQCLHGIPRHICPTVALHSEAWVIEGGAARECWPIAARARRLRI